ncbi:glycoside hydrolase family 71 protein [Auriculariales sp. MPI-PUGE-AT-0066]|nr:glycoside hydrolase family 71 protein [Auriculariales sp. MPI-PUGE-AT-0066]
MARSLSFLSAALLAMLSAAVATPAPSRVVARQTANKIVYGHFMVGVVESYSQEDWELDMRLAQETGLDAFALNIGKDSYNKQQLAYAYAAAEATGFKVFLSFDFVYWANTADDIDTIGSYLRTFADRSGQLKVGDASVVTTFFGDGFPWREAETAAGVPIYAAPIWGPDALKNNVNVDAGGQWNAWPSENNQPINANYTTGGDEWWKVNLGDKPYTAPVSPFFYTHYGADTFNKNWIFYSDWLWQPRWEQILQLQPELVQVITWNDFGESHYIGPLHPNKPDVYAGGENGAVRWVSGMPHDGLRDVAAIYIDAYKRGASAPTVTRDELVAYYRPNPKDTECSDAVGRPTGSELVSDSVFVIAMLTQPGTVVIKSGSNAAKTFDLAAGVHTVSAPMGLGVQSFELKNGDSSVLSGQGDLEIKDSCSVYNFNYFVAAIV